MEAIAARLAGWVQAPRYEDLRPDLVEATRWRVLAVVGLALAGADTPFGRSLRQGVLDDLSQPEALVRGRLGKDACSDAARADRVVCRVDPAMPGPERFKGVVTIGLHDGCRFSHSEEHNPGAPENPMNAQALWAKFTENAASLPPEAAARRPGESILALEQADDGSSILSLAIATQGVPS